MCNLRYMTPHDDELAFADQVGRHFARQYALPAMTGRVLGWLLICEPPSQTAAELGEALRASRTAIGTAVAALERTNLAQRTRAAGERADRIAVHPALGMQALEEPTEYVALGALARHGLDVLEGEPTRRRARLLEMAAFADFLAERTPVMVAEWRARRDALRASGELPTED